MSGKLHYGDYRFPYHQINLLTYFLLRMVWILYPNKKIKAKADHFPILITGLFRSGTTLTASLFNKSGVHSGNPNHLLLGRGKRAHLNNNGFLENYILMDLSMYIFDVSNGSGDFPTPVEDFPEINLNNISRKDFAYYSLVKVRDDRISNWKKLKILAKFDPADFWLYYNDNFSYPSFIKNPHFAVQMPFFLNLFSESKWYFVFKNPVDAIHSAKNVTPDANESLYCNYYKHAIQLHREGNKNIFFIAYDNLVARPEIALQQIFPDADSSFIQSACDIIDQKAPATDMNNLNIETIQLFSYMLKNCVNS